MQLRRGTKSNYQAKQNVDKIPDCIGIRMKCRDHKMKTTLYMMTSYRLVNPIHLRNFESMEKHHMQVRNSCGHVIPVLHQHLVTKETHGHSHLKTTQEVMFPLTSRNKLPFLNFLFTERNTYCFLNYWCFKLHIRGWL